MSKSKKYYWLKLKDGFFNNKEIKKLRKIAGGDTYIIIYLKMQLLSIRQGGIIRFDQTEENLAEQISLEIDENTDNIKMVLSFMKANNLIEDLSINEYLLTKVPELIGKETDAAERMRKMRRRNNVTVGDIGDVTMLHSGVTELSTQKNRNNVTPLLQDVTQRKEIREKRKEIRDKNPDYVEMVDLLISRIEENDPKYFFGKNKEAKRNNWYDPIRLLVEKDGRTLKEIRDVINWCQSNDFWKTNILSTSKLRDKFGDLVIKAKFNSTTENQDEIYDKKARDFYNSMKGAV